MAVDAGLTILNLRAGNNPDYRAIYEIKLRRVRSACLQRAVLRLIRRSVRGVIQ